MAAMFGLGRVSGKDPTTPRARCGCGCGGGRSRVWFIASAAVPRGLGAGGPGVGAGSVDEDAAADNAGVGAAEVCFFSRLLMAMHSAFEALRATRLAVSLFLMWPAELRYRKLG